MHGMGAADTAALVREVGAAPIGQLVVEMGPELCASVVHNMGVDLTADLVSALGVQVASGIVRSAGGAETGALVRALGADFVARLVTKMGVTQNVALVAALGPGLLASLVSAMGPGFIGMLSLSMSAEIFHALFGGALGEGGGGDESAQHGDSADHPVSRADTYTPAAGAGTTTAAVVSATPLSLQPTQRVLIPAVILPDTSTTSGSSSGSSAGGAPKLLPHLSDGTRIPVAAPAGTSSSTASSTSNISSSNAGQAVGGTVDTELPMVSHPITAVGSGDVLPPATHIKAVQLTHNADAVLRDVEQQFRDQIRGEEKVECGGGLCAHTTHACVLNPAVC